MQPSSDTFAMASKVVLLAAGRLCYSGPAEEVASYFQSPPLSFSAEGLSNDADFVLSVISGAQVGREGARPLAPEDFATVFRQSKYATSSPLKHDCPAIEDVQPGFPTGLANQFRVLLYRGWLTQLRQGGFIRAQLLKNVMVALICGAIFYGQGSQPVPSSAFNQTSFNVSSILYFAMMYTILGNLQAIPQLFAMRVLYVRERSASVYSTFAYWAAGAVVNLPLVVVCHLIFLNISYWLVQLVPQLRVYWYFLVVTMLNNLVAFYFAQFLAAAAPSAQVALAVFPVTFLFLTSFSGFTVPLQDLPAGWRWASFISYPRWCYEGMLANQFSVRLDNKAALNYYGFDGNKGTYVPSWQHAYWYTVPILAGFIVVMNVLVYWGLLPARSRLRYEAASSGDEASVLHVATKEGLSSLKVDGGGPRVQELLLPLTAREVEAEEEAQESHLASLIMGTLASAALLGDSHPQFDPRSTRSPSRDTLLRPALDVEDYQMRTKIQKSHGVRLLFRNLEYSIACRDRQSVSGMKQKVIICGVSGRVSPGEMCALMGGSGAGKSTLLDLLAGRKTAGCIRGDIYFNGRAGSPSCRRCSYVTQDNVHIGCFTVRETLHYASLLRIREGSSSQERCKRVDEVMSMLGLEEVADVLVGDTLRKGISGGQARRLTIGVEIINLPDLIFLDEVGSGT